MQSVVLSATPLRDVSTPMAHTLVLALTDTKAMAERFVLVCMLTRNVNIENRWPSLKIENSDNFPNRHLRYLYIMFLILKTFKVFEKLGRNET